MFKYSLVAGSIRDIRISEERLNALAKVDSKAYLVVLAVDNNTSAIINEEGERILKELKEKFQQLYIQLRRRSTTHIGEGHEETN